MIKRIKASQVVQVRTALLRQQGYRCALCGELMKANSKKNPALDHCHTTGYIRDVLCMNCNGIEGKMFNLARRAAGKTGITEWVRRWLNYHERHATPQHGGIYHHTHKTEEEKRLARNAKARRKRAAAKAVK